MTRLALEKLTDNSVASRNFNAIQAQWIKGPAQARVYNSANISIATSGTRQFLTFDSEWYDTGNLHSTTSNTGRLTAPTAGLYHVGAGIAFAANATGYREIGLRVNGTDFILVQRTPSVGAVASTSIVATTIHQLDAGDYVEVGVVQTSGGALNVTAAATTSRTCDFWITRLGSQG